MKRFLPFLLILSFLLTLTMPAMAADDATGTTLRLEETNGTVTVKDAAGKDKSAREGMRLYSGYTIATGASSSAYISLDDTKAVKLDSSGKVEIKKSGKKLEVSLTSGQIYFNVTEPLKVDESLNIRTSTMVTGIRGSFGWVNLTRMGLMHGHVTLICTNPETGETRVTEVYTGEKVSYEQAAAAGGADSELAEIDFVKEKIVLEDVPATVVEEIAKDETLRSQLAEDETVTIDVTELVESLPEKQAEEKALEEQAQETLEAAVTAQEEAIVAAAAEEKSSDASKSDTTATGGTSEQVFAASTTTSASSDDSDYSAPTTTTTTLSAASASVANVQSALNASDSVLISGSETFTVSDDLSIGSGNTLTDEGPVVVESGKALTINGTANFQNTLDNNGGTITVNSPNTLNVSSRLDNKSGMLTISSTGHVVADTITSTGTLKNAGTVTADYFTLTGGEMTMTDGTVIATILGVIAESGASSSLTLNGGTISADSTHVSGTGSKVIMNGGTISGVVALGSSSMDGVSLPGGRFTMNDGTISGGTTAVSISNSAVFTIEKGTISASNTAVVLLSNGAFTMNGGTVSAGNTGLNVNGGMVKMYGGAISAETMGVDVYAGGAFTMSGSALVSGGNTGVYVNDSGTFTMYGGEVTGATFGVHINNGTINMTAGTLTGTAGPALFLPASVTFAMDSGKTLRSKFSPVIYVGTDAYTPSGYTETVSGGYYVLTTGSSGTASTGNVLYVSDSSVKVESDDTYSVKGYLNGSLQTVIFSSTSSSPTLAQDNLYYLTYSDATVTSFAPVTMRIVSSYNGSELRVMEDSGSYTISLSAEVFLIHSSMHTMSTESANALSLSSGQSVYFIAGEETSMISTIYVYDDSSSGSGNYSNSGFAYAIEPQSSTSGTAWRFAMNGSTATYLISKRADIIERNKIYYLALDMNTDSVDDYYVTYVNQQGYTTTDITIQAVNVTNRSIYNGTYAYTLDSGAKIYDVANSDNLGKEISLVDLDLRDTVTLICKSTTVYEVWRIATGT